MYRVFLVILLILMILMATGCHNDTRVRVKPAIDIDKDSEENKEFRGVVIKELRDIILWRCGKPQEARMKSSKQSWQDNTPYDVNILDN